MQNLTLDSIDAKLLNLLQRNSALSNQDLAKETNISAPTCLRRVARLKESGLIESEVAVVSPEKLASVVGHGLTAVIEITLDRQDAGSLDAFEQRVASDDSVQQCYRVSPGPDFVLIVHAQDMPTYQQFTQRLFNSDANVRNVKAFFSVRRSKFEPAIEVKL